MSLLSRGHAAHVNHTHAGFLHCSGAGDRAAQNRFKVPPHGMLTSRCGGQTLTQTNRIILAGEKCREGKEAGNGIKRVWEVRE